MEIIEKLKLGDKRFVLLIGDHQRTAAARKLGIKYANGEYSTIVDGHDWLNEGSLDALITPFNTTIYDIIVA